MSERYVGLISGTSLDAVDAALLEIQDDDTPRLIATHGETTPSALRAELLALTQDNQHITPRRLGQLDQQVGLWFADAAVALLRAASVPHASVRALGSHGQTIYHAPQTSPPFSLQIGDPNRIAAITGIPTVADFRRADMAAGGQGAPLVPHFHHAAFTHGQHNRCLVNIGGIANISLLPAGGHSHDVRGFDTGPGNALLDEWVQTHLGDRHDTDARWANTAQVDQGLLAEWLGEPYFSRTPPKSTGREYFNLAWLRRCSPDVAGHDPATVQRTLVELSARTIAQAIAGCGMATPEVLLCGGGARNPLLRARLSALLVPRLVTDTAAYGIDGDWVEAAAFAWLAMRTLRGLPGNVPAVTGARRAVVLGGIYRP